MANKELIDQIRNRMMRGLSENTFVATEQQKLEFMNEHLELIEWVLDRLPRVSSISSAVPAAVAKAAILHGREKMDKFCEALREGLFVGTNDPVHLLWLFLLRCEGKNKKTTEVYGKTVNAINAYVQGKKSISHLRIPSRDFFNWDVNYTPKLSRRRERKARQELRVKVEQELPELTQIAEA